MTPTSAPSGLKLTEEQRQENRYYGLVLHRLKKDNPLLAVVRRIEPKPRNCFGQFMSWGWKDETIIGLVEQICTLRAECDAKDAEIARLTAENALLNEAGERCETLLRAARDRLADAETVRHCNAGTSRPAPADAVRVLVEALETAKRGIETSATDTVWVDAPSLISETVCDHIDAALSDPRVIAAQSADPWQPIASAEPEIMTEATHPGAPGLGWKLSAEAQAALDAIDASQRAAAVQFAHLIIGSAPPAPAPSEPA